MAPAKRGATKRKASATDAEIPRKRTRASTSATTQPNATPDLLAASASSTSSASTFPTLISTSTSSSTSTPTFPTSTFPTPAFLTSTIPPAQSSISTTVSISASAESSTSTALSTNLSQSIPNALSPSVSSSTPASKPTNPRSSIRSYFAPTAPPAATLPSPPLTASRPSVRAPTKPAPAKKQPAKKPATAKKPRTKKPAITPPPDARPLPSGAPVVWADGRQALCEALPYFRAYQSAAYQTRGSVTGFLVDKHNGDLPFFDEELIITRAGGGFKKDEDGMMTQVEDHKETNNAIQALRNMMTRQTPIIMIVGSNNSAFPTQIPHRYCVLGHFIVTHIWSEKNAKGKVGFKYRFQKLDLAKRSWWSSAASPDPLPRGSRDYSLQAHREQCTNCQVEAVQVYKEGWMCLNQRCRAFWKLGWKEGRSKTPGALTFNQDFLNERTQPTLRVLAPFKVKPDLPPANKGTDPTYGFSRMCWKGIVCPDCGRCSSRTQWDGWYCGNNQCHFIYKIHQSVLAPAATMDEAYPPSQGHALPTGNCEEGIKTTTQQLGHWQVTTYQLEEAGNTVTHFQANQPLIEMTHGADKIFLEVQEDNCLGLERRLVSEGIVPGGMLSNHFATNFGFPYKYVVDVASKPFKGAPDAILHSLQRLTWAGKQVVQDGSFKPFNELLAVGYFEKGSMKYHDDGESSLGPTVATLSLGGKATMTFRRKKKHCAERKDQKVLINLTLLHGDMIVMHGADVQTFYEHQVLPDDKLRFALTCRYIKPKEVPASEHWKGDYDANIVAEYDGDLEAFEEAYADQMGG